MLFLFLYFPKCCLLGLTLHAKICITLCVLISCYCRFPLINTELAKKWVVAIRRQKWQPKPTDFICSEHFAASSFRLYRSQRRLREDAVPEIFNFPQHLTKKLQNRRVLVRNSSSAAPVSDAGSEQSLHQSSCGTSEIPTSSSRALIDHSYYVTSSPRSIKRKYEDLLEKEKVQRSLIVKKF